MWRFSSFDTRIAIIMLIMLLVGAISVLNHFYGRDSIPIGAYNISTPGATLEQQQPLPYVPQVHAAAAPFHALRPLTPSVSLSATSPPQFAAAPDPPPSPPCVRQLVEQFNSPIRNSTMAEDAVMTCE